MYLDYWHLTAPPFANAPNREIFYASPQHEEALMRLLYAVQQHQGVALLTGEVGSGKTTIGHVLMAKLPKDEFRLETIINPALTPLDLIRAILTTLGQDAESDSKVTLLARLQDHLVREARRGIRTILLIDEGHLIRDSASMEELRMLLNMQLDGQFLVNLLILGQPPLLKKIETMNPLKERISIKYHLAPLDYQNSLRYILFRLKAAGSKRGIFTRQAIQPIHEYAKGLPLRINNLCDRCMLAGMMRKTRVVSSKIVQEAIADIQ